MWYSTPHKLLKNFKLIEARTPFCLRPRHGSRHFASTKRWDRIRQCTFPKFINHHDQLWCLIPRGIFYSRPSIQKKTTTMDPAASLPAPWVPSPAAVTSPPTGPKIIYSALPPPWEFLQEGSFLFAGGLHTSLPTRSTGSLPHHYLTLLPTLDYLPHFYRG